VVPAPQTALPPSVQSTVQSSSAMPPSGPPSVITTRLVQTPSQTAGAGDPAAAMPRAYGVHVLPGAVLLHPHASIATAAKRARFMSALTIPFCVASAYLRRAAT
jgi:hypothetical protein